MAVKESSALYEGVYIVNAALSEEARDRVLQEIQDGITGKGGEVHKVHEWGRRRLAYEIDGRREGFYYLVYFTAPTQIIKELWKEYRLSEDLIRFLTLRTESVLEEIKFKEIEV